MGKVNASLADVQTEYKPPVDGDYEMKVVEIDESGNAGEKPVVIIKSVVDEAGNPEYGKPVYDRLYMKTKKGEDNKFTLAQIKRYFNAIAGEDRANAADLDYDELLNGRFRGVIENESYKDKNDKDRVQARLADILAL